MLNRRHIRIKVMQLLFAFRGTESDDLKKYENMLQRSMDGMFELYLLVISLLLEVRLRAVEYTKLERKKHLATAAERIPNTKFVDNQLLIKIAESKRLEELVQSRKLNNWKENDEYVDLIFKAIRKSPVYEKYMSDRVNSFEEDKSFILDIYKQIIAPNDKLYSYYEDCKITWLDDLPVINTLFVKLIKRSSPSSSGDLLIPGLFRDEEDRQFGFDLMNKTILNLSFLTGIIEEKTMNWDKDRIANLDLVLLQMAICEIEKFPSIPVKVTINEYLEIAKEYSTPKSSNFINGILDKTVKEHQAKGTLNKAGRGLM
ncbi:MAG: transcription antitermination factor NusB [Flavobacteriaceae bacterium]|nr:transcription antitermination factor NusB [Flavobacteriaceae bacterium]